MNYTLLLFYEGEYKCIMTKMVVAKLELGFRLETKETMSILYPKTYTV